ncbi:MAG: energy transducer TonB [Bacteroidales bacterium]|nr:energy transducer TonB [Bacteroidales bacterium]
MRKVYLLMAAAAILMVGCKNNGSKKAAAAAAAQEEEAAAAAQAYNDAIDAFEAQEGEEINIREAVEKLSAAQPGSQVESVAEVLEKDPDAVLPFQAVEVKPTFEGGDANDFSKWVNSHLEYPQEAVDKNIAGRVVLQFTVNKLGEVKDVKVVRGVNELLDNEAVRVVASSPKWEPATQNGVPVSVNYTFPVIFKIN